jgi:FkbM family methyltransferase
MRRFYGQWIGPGDLCFDVGANVGDRTQIFRALGARVIAVDPQPSCVQTLTRRWGSDSGVTLVPFALGRAPGRAKLKVCTEASTISTLSSEWTQEGRFSRSYQWDSEVDVEVTTLDALIERYGTPNFIKVDVEGFEHEVLAGLHSKTPCISIEYAKEMKSVTQAAMHEIERSLEGQAEFAFSAGETMRWATPWVTATELWKLLDARTDSEDWGDIYARPHTSSRA